MERELPPRRVNESDDMYFRRGTHTVRRKERMAQSFAIDPGAPDIGAGPTASAPPFSRTARFEDVGSISTAQARPYRNYISTPMAGATTGPGNVSTFSMTHGTQAPEADTFHQDQERTIRRIAHREIGEVLQLPPHIKIPKTDAPLKFKGEDNLDIFMKFVELHCHLDSAALEWYIQTVNSAHYSLQQELTFTDALCALHRRFITSANAQRATSAFDALLKRANLMHHVPDEFAVNRKFLAGLPQTIRYKLRVDRELSAEYSPFATRRSHACQLWNALNSEDVPSAPSRVHAATPRTSNPAVSAIPAPRRAGPLAPNHTRPASSATAPTLRPSGDDTRTCFKCGALGHIGSNPICPRYRDSAPLGARVGAQRVLESYTEGDGPDDDVATGGVGAEGSAQDEPWGVQYDADFDPNESPDLADLVAMEEPAEVAEELDPETPSESEAVPHSPGLLDLDRFELTLGVASNREWTAQGEVREALASAAASASSAPPIPAFTTLLARFEERAGSTPLTMTQTIELESIDAIGAEEHAHDVWRHLISLHPPLRLRFSLALLRTTAIDLDHQALLFQGDISNTRQHQQDLLDLLARRLDARDEISRLSNLPLSSSSTAGSNLVHAGTLNQGLCGDIEHHVLHLERRLERLLSSQRNIDEELTRRMLARELYAFQSAQEAPSSLAPRTTAYLPVADGGEEAHPARTAAEARINDPPPTLGSTPPPSYPGTPESSGSSEMWQTLPNHDDAVNTSVFLPGDLAVVWISDSEGSGDVALDGEPVPTDSDPQEGTLVRETFVEDEDNLLPDENAVRDSPEDVLAHSSAHPLQLRAQKVVVAPPVERLSNICRPASSQLIGLLDQPKRVRSNMACLSAMLSIGNSTAYMLFDSGSNTNSITPEYAHATGSSRIKLDEQVTLQLGCVGSRSKISYGTRAAIDFGGVKGHLYLDQVNLDRYDGIIGTPFMNRHGVILDFGR
ncbi:hypothetical protein DFH09DRAFT_1330935 [Mycena vulgaris]|nr:hypothetical protein DFH09DRAFT_1330935 [Mycena vulgaris]